MKEVAIRHGCSAVISVNSFPRNQGIELGSTVDTREIVAPYLCVCNSQLRKKMCALHEEL